MTELYLLHQLRKILSLLLWALPLPSTHHLYPQHIKDLSSPDFFPDLYYVDKVIFRFVVKRAGRYWTGRKRGGGKDKETKRKLK